MKDISLDYQGSVTRITPLTERGSDWIDCYLDSESYQWLGNSLVVESKFVPDIVFGMEEWGLLVE